MSKLSQETIAAINKGAQSTLTRASSDLKYSAGYFDGYSTGATEWAGKAQEPLIDLLDEARLQIEYLHKKFGETGSGNNLLARIETELVKYKEVENG